MSELQESVVDRSAIAVALVLLLAMIGFASQGNHTKDKAWNAMVEQVGPLIGLDGE